MIKSQDTFKHKNISSKEQMTLLTKFATHQLMLLLIVIILTLSLNVDNKMLMVSAQGVKGGSSLSQSNFGKSSSSSGQLSQTFVQMFNQLSPVDQQRFVNSMSSTNKNIFMQAFPGAAQYFNEEISSQNTGSQVLAPIQIGGTKSSSFKRQQSSSVVAPVQQQQSFFRSEQKSSAFQQPTIQPSTFQSFQSRKTSQQIQPTFIPSTNSESLVQRQQTVVNQPITIPQSQSSYYNKVSQVSQVAQPIVLPQSESSFRKIMSFSSQPLFGQTNSDFSQQKITEQQIQAQPIQLGMNRFTSIQSSSAQPIQSGFNQIVQQSSSSGLGGAGFGGNFATDFSQEKVDANGAIIGGSLGSGSSQFEGLNQIQQTSLPVGGSSSLSNFEQSSFSGSSGNSGLINQFGSTGFESADIQQKNLQIPEEYNGATAASINNKWYIMRPIENPSALGLGDARTGSIKRLSSTSGKLLGEKSASSLTSSTNSASSGRLVSNIATTSNNNPATLIGPKKRSTEKKKNKRGREEDDEVEETSLPVSTSSSLMEADDEEEKKRR